MNGTTSIVTQKMIWDELCEQRKILKKILERDLEHSIEELSLHKTQKLLKISPVTIINEVKNGNLKARTYRDKNRKIRYRFRIADVREFQKSKEYDHVSLHAEGYESAEAIAKRIFGNRD
ncbi:MAG: hypothetical protein KKB34_04915 [Bacteroidetes bacterium]|nr:hypothetical protein [Bacteroidota bacterium]